jgi:hypothetical protein
VNNGLERGGRAGRCREQYNPADGGFKRAHLLAAEVKGERSFERGLTRQCAAAMRAGRRGRRSLVPDFLTPATPCFDSGLRIRPRLKKSDGRRRPLVLTALGSFHLIAGLKVCGIALCATPCELMLLHCHSNAKTYLLLSFQLNFDLVFFSAVQFFRFFANFRVGEGRRGAAGGCRQAHGSREPELSHFSSFSSVAAPTAPDAAIIRLINATRGVISSAIAVP